MKKIITKLILTSMFLTNMAFAAEATNKVEEQAPEHAVKPISAPLEKKQRLKFKNRKPDYSQYLIPTEGYMPVGTDEDRSIKIAGTVSKSLELNLADCLELALINNPRVKAAYANSAAIKTHRGQTLSNYSPRVNLQSGLSRMKPDTSASSSMSSDPYEKYLLGTIGIQQLIYDFGVTQNQYTIDKLEHQASIDNIDGVVNDVVYQVKDAYYYLMLAVANKNVMQETVEQFQQTYNQAKAFYDVGYKAKIDVTIAEVNLSDARARLIEANYGVDVAISRLNNAMGLPFINPYIVDGKLPFENVDISMRQAVEIANKSRPDLKIALVNVKMADQYVKLAKKVAKPKLQFSANLSSGGRDGFTDRNWYDFGGYLSFPMVNPFLIKNQIHEAKYLYEKQQYDTKASVNDMYYEIQQTYAKLIEKKERVPVAKLSVKAALENYDIAKGRYKVGLSDPIELKDAQISYLNSRVSYLQTLYEYNSAKAMLERAIGQTLKDEKAEEVEI